MRDTGHYNLENEIKKEIKRIKKYYAEQLIKYKVLRNQCFLKGDDINNYILMWYEKHVEKNIDFLRAPYGSKDLIRQKWIIFCKIEKIFKEKFSEDCSELIEFIKEKMINEK